ncbi:hypothetical protein RUR49_11725 [Pseudoxanthobacter sp. M-2]|uniref:hypothetical protein n=1 Tax=Pseudoxanthobacter sp. M-2 TaxID=3078754 RepID=UPI0038FC4F23
MAKAAIDDFGGSLTVTVPMTFRKRGGRKLVISPPGAEAWAPPRARVDNAMVKALARAHRWRKLLDGGRYQTVRDLAKAENINPSYVARVLRLTLLAPDIVEAILDGRHDPERVTLDRLMEPFSVVWCEQLPQ